MKHNGWRKLLIAVLLTAAFTVLLSGCMRVSMDITLKGDGKADILLLYAMDDSLTAMMDEGQDIGLSSEDMEAFREKGAEVTEYAEEGYTGYLITMKDSDLNSAGIAQGADAPLRKENGMYILDLNLLSNEEEGQLDSSAASMIKSAGGYFTVTVTLPVEPERHNATKVSEDGKTLEWDLLTMDSSEPIHVEYKADSFPVLVVVIALVVILAAVVLAVLLLKKRKAPTEAAYESGNLPNRTPEDGSGQESDMQL